MSENNKNCDPCFGNFSILVLCGFFKSVDEIPNFLPNEALSTLQDTSFKEPKKKVDFKTRLQTFRDNLMYFYVLYYFSLMTMIIFSNYYVKSKTGMSIGEIF